MTGGQKNDGSLDPLKIINELIAFDKADIINIEIEKKRR